MINKKKLEAKAKQCVADIKNLSKDCTDEELKRVLVDAEIFISIPYRKRMLGEDKLNEIGFDKEVGDFFFDILYQHRDVTKWFGIEFQINDREWMHRINDSD